MTAETLPGRLFERAAQAPHEPIWRQWRELNGTRELVTTTYGEVARQVLTLAIALLRQGVTPGSSVAVLSATRPEWLIADFAIQAVGGTTISIYPSINQLETAYIVYDSGASIVVAENEEQVQKLLAIVKTPSVIAGHEERATREVQILLSCIIAIEAVKPHPLVTQFQTLLDEVSSGNLRELKEDITPEVAASLLPLNSISKDSRSTLVYTSGTSGPPKGVVQLHRNHCANVDQVMKTGIFKPGEEIFLFLPLAHSFARLVGYLGSLTSAILVFPGVIDTKSSRFDATTMLRDLRESDPHIFPAVPRIFQKLAEGVQNRASERTVSGFILSLALASAKRMRLERESKGAVRLMTRLLYEGTARVRGAVRQKLFGKRFTFGVSGGAKLPIEVANLFYDLGVEILEGYGLTETAVVTNVNLPGRNRIGSVGPPLCDVEVMISEEGEILFRGPNVAVGYHLRPQATAEAWREEGWFHTGDLGSIDPRDGTLSITGRKKEIIVTAGGKKVAPVPIEEQCKRSPVIGHVVLIGDDRPYCVALVTLAEGAKATIRTRGRSSAGGPSDAQLEEATKIISRELSEVNRSLSSFEQIKRFALLDEDFTIENGLLTPTFKVKRREVARRYAERIEALYQGELGVEVPPR